MGAGFGCVVSKVTIWGKGARPGKWEHTVNGGTVNGGTTVPSKKHDLFPTFDLIHSIHDHNIKQKS